MQYTTIVQISDIHIRAGDTQQSRFTEYQTQIDRLLQALTRYDTETTLVVLLGDIFHDKSKIGPSAQILAQRLFNGLSTFKTVVIRGNHDYRQDQPDEPDLIKPFFEHQPENISYYDETGLYQVGDVEIGLVAVQDTLIRGAAGGIMSELTEFPQPSTDDDTVNHRIALFHGSFGGALLQNGTDVDNRNNYPLEWIKGYDMMLFGDIHVQQLHRVKSEPGNDFTSREAKDLYVTGKYQLGDKVPWAYAGSLIQQNFGESLWGHGFIEWNLESRSATAYHLRNEVGNVIVTLNANDEPCVKFRIGRRQQTLLVSTVVTYGWFPKQISLRFAPQARNMVQNIQSMFEEAGIVVRDTGFVPDGDLEDASTANVTHEAKKELVNDLSELNSPQAWVSYFTETAGLPEGDWSQWVHHPNLLTTPCDVFEPPVSTKIQERNTKFRKTLESYTQSRDVKAPVRQFRIHYMDFSNLLCYGQSNHIDFDDFSKSICLVNGNNGSGKSSFLEIICIALYGESFPSRYNKSYSAAIINLTARSAYTRIMFSINGKSYWLTRTFEPAPKNPKNLWQRSVRLTDFDTNEVLRQNANVVDPWVIESIGEFQHFLLTTIMSQSNDSDFFAMAPKDQKSIIDSLLQLNVCEDFKTILKESKLNHEYALNALDSYESGAKSQTALVSTLHDVDVNALTERQTTVQAELAVLQTQLAEAKAHFSNQAERIFHTPLQDYVKEQKSLDLTDPTPDETYMRTLDAAKEHLSVLKTKRYPPVQQPKRSKPFAELEQQLNELKMQRAAHPSGNVRPYDAAEHKAWLNQNAKRPEQPEKPLHELEYELTRVQEELAQYEIAEEDAKPVSAKVLAGLKKQHDELTAELDALDQEIRLREKELSAQQLSPKIRAQVDQYNAALSALTTAFGCAPSEAESRLAVAATASLTLTHLRSELDNVESQLKEVGQVKYNPKCASCNENPFRLKAEQLLASQKATQAKVAAATAELTTLTNGQPLDHLQSVYATWRALHSDKMLSYINADKRASTLNTELKTLRISAAEKEETREELDYENLVIINEFCDLKKRHQVATASVAGARYFKELQEWNAAAAVADLDATIQKVADATAHAYAIDLQETKNLVKERDELMASVERFSRAQKRTTELTAIIAAYPHYTMYQQLDAKYRPLSSEQSSLEAQIRQAQAIHGKLQQARTQAQRIADFRAVLEQRTATIKALADAFDNYTDFVYPSRVGPAIESAVNTVLNSIALPRPIRLQAQWDGGHFNWLVQDGTQSPPYEKCSGAQRFFVSLALRFAFSRMGASNMINAQIFLDEGFTACDVETMERVPTLLNSLLKETEYLQTIFLVSHMDTLKSTATRSIQITRGAHASQLQIGERREAPRAKATKTTVGVAAPLQPTDAAEEGEVMEAVPIPTKRRGRPKKDQGIVVS